MGTLRYKQVVAAFLFCISCSLCRPSLSTRRLQGPHDLTSILDLNGPIVVESLHHEGREHDEKEKPTSIIFSDQGGRSIGDDIGRQEGEEEQQQQQQHRKQDAESERHESFVLEKPMMVMKTDAGELRILPHVGINSEFKRERLGLGLLRLEPKALLLPQYMDVDCLFLVHKGRGHLSWVEEGGEAQQVEVEAGDIFEIESGTVFYMLNPDEGQRLSVFSIFDTSPVVNNEIFHSFFVAGGQKPKTVLSGFDEDVLATVFKAPADEVHDMLSSQMEGPIIYFSGTNASKRAGGGTLLMGMLNRFTGLPKIFPEDSSKKPYNLFKKKADFSNDYGSTVAIHGKDFKLLKEVNKGVFLVQLKAGALLAPHWNPRATEIALVTKGEGQIQIVYPNGSAATTARVSEGSVFYAPQNFPMCQIASRSGPFEFVGFTTSARPNRPQFLAGSNSVLKGIEAEVLASSFNIPVEHLQHFLHLQDDAVILPRQPLEATAPLIKAR